MIYSPIPIKDLLGASVGLEVGGFVSCPLPFVVTDGGVLFGGDKVVTGSTSKYILNLF